MPYYQTVVISALDVYDKRLESGLKTDLTPDRAKTFDGQRGLARIIGISLCAFCEAVCSQMDSETGVAFASKGNEARRVCKA
ncbi:hypothetical protein CANDROIZ_170005 [Candidatus Roizmanbacteria bacterium]|nr:hypothetical protein CANDROIZ_170005 [Candidatus Roizmanbacteria bacterium]